MSYYDHNASELDGFEDRIEEMSRRMEQTANSSLLGEKLQSLSIPYYDKYKEISLSIADKYEMIKQNYIDESLHLEGFKKGKLVFPKTLGYNEDGSPNIIDHDGDSGVIQDDATGHMFEYRAAAFNEYDTVDLWKDVYGDPRYGDRGRGSKRKQQVQPAMVAELNDKRIEDLTEYDFLNVEKYNFLQHLNMLKDPNYKFQRYDKRLDYNSLVEVTVKEPIDILYKVHDTSDYYGRNLTEIAHPITGKSISNAATLNPYLNARFTLKNSLNTLENRQRLKKFNAEPSLEADNTHTLDPITNRFVKHSYKANYDLDRRIFDYDIDTNLFSKIYNAAVFDVKRAAASTTESFYRALINYAPDFLVDEKDRKEYRDLLKTDHIGMSVIDRQMGIDPLMMARYRKRMAETRLSLDQAADSFEKGEYLKGLGNSFNFIFNMFANVDNLLADSFLQTAGSIAITAGTMGAGSSVGLGVLGRTILSAATAGGFVALDNLSQSREDYYKNNGKEMPIGDSLAAFGGLWVAGMGEGLLAIAGLSQLLPRSIASKLTGKTVEQLVKESKPLRNIAIAMFGEGAQEVVEDTFIDYFGQKVDENGNKTRTLADCFWNLDRVESFTGGAAMGGVLSAVPAVKNSKAVEQMGETFNQRREASKQITPNAVFEVDEETQKLAAEDIKTAYQHSDAVQKPLIDAQMAYSQKQEGAEEKFQQALQNVHSKDTIDHVEELKRLRLTARTEEAYAETANELNNTVTQVLNTIKVNPSKSLKERQAEAVQFLQEVGLTAEFVVENIIQNSHGSAVYQQLTGIIPSKNQVEDAKRYVEDLGLFLGLTPEEIKKSQEKVHEEVMFGPSSYTYAKERIDYALGVANTLKTKFENGTATDEEKAKYEDALKLAVTAGHDIVRLNGHLFHRLQQLNNATEELVENPYRSESTPGAYPNLSLKGKTAYARRDDISFYFGTNNSVYGLFNQISEELQFGLDALKQLEGPLRKEAIKLNNKSAQYASLIVKNDDIDAYVTKTEDRIAEERHRFENATLTVLADTTVNENQNDHDTHIKQISRILQYGMDDKRNKKAVAILKALELRHPDAWKDLKTRIENIASYDGHTANDFLEIYNKIEEDNKHAQEIAQRVRIKNETSLKNLDEALTKYTPEYVDNFINSLPTDFTSLIDTEEREIAKKARQEVDALETIYNDAKIVKNVDQNKLKQIQNTFVKVQKAVHNFEQAYKKHDKKTFTKADAPKIKHLRQTYKTLPLQQYTADIATDQNIDLTDPDQATKYRTKIMYRLGDLKAWRSGANSLIQSYDVIDKLDAEVLKTQHALEKELTRVNQQIKTNLAGPKQIKQNIAYLEKTHAKYNSEAIQELIENEQIQDYNNKGAVRKRINKLVGILSKILDVDAVLSNTGIADELQRNELTTKVNDIKKSINLLNTELQNIYNRTNPINADITPSHTPRYINALKYLKTYQQKIENDPQVSTAHKEMVKKAIEGYQQIDKYHKFFFGINFNKRYTPAEYENFYRQALKLTRESKEYRTVYEKILNKFKFSQHESDRFHDIFSLSVQMDNELAYLTNLLYASGKVSAHRQAPRTNRTGGGADFVMQSGGNAGAETMWSDAAEKEHMTVNHFRIPETMRHTSKTSFYIDKNDADIKQGLILAQMVHADLGRPWDYDSRQSTTEQNKKYEAARSWLQVKYADAVYAAGRLLREGQQHPSHKNITIQKTDQFDGMTGHTIHMALMHGKPVFAYDVYTKKWYKGTYDSQTHKATFTVYDQPIVLTKKFAGIGNRRITKDAQPVIEKVVKDTIESIKNNTYDTLIQELTKKTHNDQDQNKLGEPSYTIQHFVPGTSGEVKLYTADQIKNASKDELTPEKLKEINHEYDRIYDIIDDRFELEFLAKNLDEIHGYLFDENFTLDLIMMFAETKKRYDKQIAFYKQYKLNFNKDDIVSWSREFDPYQQNSKFGDYYFRAYNTFFQGHFDDVAKLKELDTILTEHNEVVQAIQHRSETEFKPHKVDFAQRVNELKQKIKNRITQLERRQTPTPTATTVDKTVIQIPNLLSKSIFDKVNKALDPTQSKPDRIDVSVYYGNTEPQVTSEEGSNDHIVEQFMLAEWQARQKYIKPIEQILTKSDLTLNDIIQAEQLLQNNINDIQNDDAFDQLIEAYSRLSEYSVYKSNKHTYDSDLTLELELTFYETLLHNLHQQLDLQNLVINFKTATDDAKKQTAVTKLNDFVTQYVNDIKSKINPLAIYENVIYGRCVFAARLTIDNVNELSTEQRKTLTKPLTKLYDDLINPTINNYIKNHKYVPTTPIEVTEAEKKYVLNVADHETLATVQANFDALFNNADPTVVSNEIREDLREYGEYITRQGYTILTDPNAVEPHMGSLLAIASMHDGVFQKELHGLALALIYMHHVKRNHVVPIWKSILKDTSTQRVNRITDIYKDILKFNAHVKTISDLEAILPNITEFSDLEKQTIQHIIELAKFYRIDQVFKYIEYLCDPYTLEKQYSPTVTDNTTLDALVRKRITKLLADLGGLHTYVNTNDAPPSPKGDNSSLTIDNPLFHQQFLQSHEPETTQKIIDGYLQMRDFKDSVLQRKLQELTQNPEAPINLTLAQQAQFQHQLRRIRHQLQFITEYGQKETQNGPFQPLERQLLRAYWNKLLEWQQKYERFVPKKYTNLSPHNLGALWNKIGQYEINEAPEVTLTDAELRQGIEQGNIASLMLGRTAPRSADKQKWLAEQWKIVNQASAVYIVSEIHLAESPALNRNNVISTFRGRHSFLSNMYETPITYGGLTYRSVENAFQAAKTSNQALQREFTDISPADARTKGRSLELTPEELAVWEDRKDAIMRELLRIKFSNPALRQQLLNTKDALFNHANTWGDQYWGTVLITNEDGTQHYDGLNKLGVMLRETRDNLMSDTIEGSGRYALQFSVMNNKPVYVYDIKTLKWYQATQTNTGATRIRQVVDSPTLVDNFVGITSTEKDENNQYKKLPQEAIHAIKSVVDTHPSAKLTFSAAEIRCIQSAQALTSIQFVDEINNNLSILRNQLSTSQRLLKQLETLHNHTAVKDIYEALQQRITELDEKIREKETTSAEETTPLAVEEHTTSKMLSTKTNPGVNIWVYAKDQAKSLAKIAHVLSTTDAETHVVTVNTKEYNADDVDFWTHNYVITNKQGDVMFVGSAEEFQEYAKTLYPTNQKFQNNLFDFSRVFNIYNELIYNENKATSSLNKKAENYGNTVVNSLNYGFASDTVNYKENDTILNNIKKTMEFYHARWIDYLTHNVYINGQVYRVDRAPEKHNSAAYIASNWIHNNPFLRFMYEWKIDKDGNFLAGTRPDLLPYLRNLKMNDLMLANLDFTLRRACAQNDLSKFFGEDGVDPSQAAMLFGEDNKADEERNLLFKQVVDAYGMPINFLCNELGQMFWNNLGVKPNNELGTEEFYSKLLVATGDAILQYGRALGLFEFNMYSPRAVAQAEAEREFGTKLIDNPRNQAEQDQNERIEERIKTLIKENPVHQQQWLMRIKPEALQRYKQIRDTYIDVFEDTFVPEKEKQFKLQTKPMYRANEVENIREGNLAPNEKYMTGTKDMVRVPWEATVEMRHLATIPHTMDMPLMTRLMQTIDITDGSRRSEGGVTLLQLFLENNTDVTMDEDEFEFLSLDMQNSENGRFQSIDHTARGLEIAYYQLQELPENQQNCYFKYKMVRNSRYMLDCPWLNPQTNKTARFLLPMRQWNKVYDPKDIDDINHVKFAVCQAFDKLGVKDNEQQAIYNFFAKMSLEDLNEMFQSACVEGFTKTLSKSKFQYEFDGKKHSLEVENAAQCLTVIEHFIKMRKAELDPNNTNNKFASFLAVETDATTSGYCIKMLNIPIASLNKDWYEKIGVLIDDNTEKSSQTMAQLKQGENFNDIYKSASILTNDQMVAVLGSNFSSIDFSVLKNNRDYDNLHISDDNISLMNLIFPALPKAQFNELTQQFEITKALRNLLKPAVMVYNYTAGLRSIAKNLSYVILQQDFVKTYLNFKRKDMTIDEFINDQFNLNDPENANNEEIKLKAKQEHARLTAIVNTFEDFFFNNLVDNTTYVNLKTHKVVQVAQPSDMVGLLQNVSVATIKLKNKQSLFALFNDSIYKTYGQWVWKGLEEVFGEYNTLNESMNDLAALQASHFIDELDRQMDKEAFSNGIPKWKNKQMIESVRNILPRVTLAYDNVETRDDNYVRLVTEDKINDSRQGHDVKGIMLPVNQEELENVATVTRSITQYDPETDKPLPGRDRSKLMDVKKVLTQRSLIPQLTKFGGPGRIGAVFPVHGTDSHIMTRMFFLSRKVLGIPILGIHDAIVCSAKASGVISYCYNGATALTNKYWSMYESLYNDTVNNTWLYYGLYEQKTHDYIKAHFHELFPDTRSTPFDNTEQGEQEYRRALQDAMNIRDPELKGEKLILLMQQEFVANDLVKTDLVDSGLRDAQDNPIMEKKILFNDKYYVATATEQEKFQQNRRSREHYKNNVVDLLNYAHEQLYNDDGIETRRADFYNHKIYIANMGGDIGSGFTLYPDHQRLEQALTNLYTPEDFLNAGLISPAMAENLIPTLEQQGKQRLQELNFRSSTDLFGSYAHWLQQTLPLAHNGSVVFSNPNGFITTGALQQLVARANHDPNARITLAMTLRNKSATLGLPKSSDVHFERLVSILKLMDPKVLSKLDVQLGPAYFNSGMYNKDTHTVALGYDNRTGHMDSFRNAAIESDLSLESVYTHEVIHAGLKFAFRNRHIFGITDLWEKIRDLMMYIKNNNIITPNDFIPENIDPALQAHYETFAKQQYDYVFDNPNTLSDQGLEEAIPICLTNPRIAEKLLQHKNANKPNKNLFFRLVDLVKSMFKALFMKDGKFSDIVEAMDNLVKKGDKKQAANLYESLLDLTDQLFHADVQAERTIRSGPWAYVDTMFNKLDYFKNLGNKYAINLIDNVTDFMQYPRVPAGRPYNTVEKIRKQLADWVHDLLVWAPPSGWRELKNSIVLPVLSPFSPHVRTELKHRLINLLKLNQYGLTNSLMKDFCSRDEGSKAFEHISLYTRSIDQASKALEACVRQDLEEALTPNDQKLVMKTAATRAVLMTDGQCLINDDFSNIDEYKTYLTDENARLREIGRLQQFIVNTFDSMPNGKIKAIQTMKNWTIAQIKGLAKLMVTGQGHDRQNLNAHNIAILNYCSSYYLQFRRNQVQGFEEAVDKLISLYAIHYTKKEYRDFAASISTNGLKAYFKTYRQFIQESENGVPTEDVKHQAVVQQLFPPDPRNRSTEEVSTRHKGYIKHILDNSKELVVDLMDADTKKKREAAGYKLIDNFYEKVRNIKLGVYVRRNYYDDEHRDGCAFVPYGVHHFGLSISKTIEQSQFEDGASAKDRFKDYMKAIKESSNDTQKALMELEPSDANLQMIYETSSKCVPIPRTAPIIRNDQTGQNEYRIHPLGYRYTANIDFLVEQLGMDMDAVYILSRMFASNNTKAQSFTMNQALIQFLHKYQTANMDPITHQLISSDPTMQRNLPKFVQIAGTSDNKEMQKVWPLIPKQIKDFVEKEDLYIREDWLDEFLGVEQVSISNINLPTQTSLQNLVTNRHAVDPPTISKSAARDKHFKIRSAIRLFELGLKAIGTQTKKLIVMGLPAVFINNIISNFNFSVANHTNPITVFKMQAKNFRYAIEYTDTMKKYRQIQYKKRMKTATKSELSSLNTLKAKLQHNPVAPLMEAGMFQNIVEDIKEADLDKTGKVYKTLEKMGLVDKATSLPKWLQSTGGFLFRNLTLANSSGIYKFIYTVTQYSDFVARATEYQLLMDPNPKSFTDVKKHITGFDKVPEKFIKQNDQIDINPDYVSYRQAVLSYVLDSFINYDRPQNKYEQYLNDMGLVMFTKFAKRIQPVVMNRLRYNPIGMLMQLAFHTLAFDTEDIGEQQFLAKHWSALGHNPIDNFFTAITPWAFQTDLNPHITS